MSNREDFKKWAKEKKKKPITSFSFGPYKGVNFEDVPTSFLKWFVENGTGTKELYDTVEQIYWGREQGTIPRPISDYNEGYGM